MLIRMTVPKLFRRTLWTQSAGTWQPKHLGEHASYKQHKPSAGFTQIQCINDKQMLSPLASAKTEPSGKISTDPHVPLYTLSISSEAKTIRGPETLHAQNSSSVLIL